jgi:hypothetical protein
VEPKAVDAVRKHLKENGLENDVFGELRARGPDATVTVV